MPARRNRKPNIVLLGIDSLRRDHMSCYGYSWLTTPHIDRFAQESALFEQTFSAYIPTRLSAYAWRVDAHRARCLHHAGRRAAPQGAAVTGGEDAARTAARGRLRHDLRRLHRQSQFARFRQYIDYPSWGSWNEGRSPKAQSLNEVALPELDRLLRKRDPFFLFLRHMDPHSPYLPRPPLTSACSIIATSSTNATNRWSR